MLSFLLRLREPDLVVDFQRFCGLVSCVEDKRFGDGNEEGGDLVNGVLTSHMPSAAQRTRHPKNTEPISVSAPQKKYKIENRFLYYLFLFAAMLGQEIFYVIFFPFCYWNIDPYIARRVTNIWAFVMYIGQASKDILRWPRPPSPPVFKLEVRVDAEYGMPSTHAMGATVIPFAFLLATMYKYKYPFEVGLLVAVTICALVSLSRIYNGMHTVLDVVCGVTITVLLIAVTYPFWDAIDDFQKTNPLAPCLALTIPLLLLMCYPEMDHWSTTRGDTATILSVWGGAAISTWINHQWVQVPEVLMGVPLAVPSLTMNLLCRMVTRVTVGSVVLILTWQAVNAVALTVVCGLAGVSPEDQEARKLLKVEVPYKYIVYSCLTVVCLVFCPAVYGYLEV